MWKFCLRLGIEGVPGYITGEVSVSVVHTDRVDLLFVTFNTMWCSDVISKDPSLCGSLATSDCGERSARVKGKTDICKIPVDCVFVQGQLLRAGFM